ncbi:DgyrCDS3546 [Dimorphilus gyrociliatus]|nr:DgyrCDS3546 [Dimorphilus gyrociliatus]
MTSEGEENNMDLELDGGEGEEEYFDGDENGINEDTRFDETIGSIEDIVMDEKFQTMQNTFLEKYYMEFENTEENKFIYTDIHKEYCELIEKHIETELQIRIPDFQMDEFAKELENRKDELDGEIFEMLLTFSDFMIFKEMFLDYKSAKEGNTVDLSSGICIRHFGSEIEQLSPMSSLDFTLSPTS